MGSIHREGARQWECKASLEVGKQSDGGEMGGQAIKIKAHQQ